LPKASFTIRDRRAQNNILPLRPILTVFRSELRPNTGSVVARLDKLPGTMRTGSINALPELARATNFGLRSPPRLLAAHAEEHNRWLSYRELADQLIPYVKELGYTHIELLPHHGASLRRLVGLSNARLFRRHQPLRLSDGLHGICGPLHQPASALLLDWTPAHFPRDTHGLHSLTARTYTNIPIRARVRIPIGARSFTNYGRQREVVNFPYFQRALLAGQISH